MMVAPRAGLQEAFLAMPRSAMWSHHQVGTVAGCMVTEARSSACAKVDAARQCRHPRRHTSRLSSASRTRCAKWRPLSSAAWPSRTTMNSRVKDVIECFEIEEVGRPSRSAETLSTGLCHAPRRSASTASPARTARASCSVGSEFVTSSPKMIERGGMRDPDLRGASITITAVDVSHELHKPTPSSCRWGPGLRSRGSRMRRAAPWFRTRGVGRRTACAMCEIRLESTNLRRIERIESLLRRTTGVVVANDVKGRDLKSPGDLR